MPPRPIAASFWRGGTSRGVLFRAETLAPFEPTTRDAIIRSALGSPDPAGRQITGLGGGVSSLSKAAIVGLPGEGSDAQKQFGKLPGVAWADDVDKAKEWDVVYRFCQVGVRDTTLDWTATCGNMIAAVAVHALTAPLLPYTTLFTRARSLPRPKSPEAPLLFPVRILSASNGQVIIARVPIDPYTLEIDEPEEGQGVVIAGVPGEGAGIEVEMPIAAVDGAEGGLVTGRVVETILVEDKEIKISILTTGLPNIFVDIRSLDLDPSLLAASASSLTNHPTLPILLERIRQAAASKFNIPLSLASPKITVIGPMPYKGYTSSTGNIVAQDEADLLVRAVSSGDFHATIPGTTLGALNLGAGAPGTVISELLGNPEEAEVVTVRAGHAAGVASSAVRFVVDGPEGKRRPESVVMTRTANEIMRGDILVPAKVFRTA